MSKAEARFENQEISEVRVIAVINGQVVEFLSATSEEYGDTMNVQVHMAQGLERKRKWPFGKMFQYPNGQITFTMSFTGISEIIKQRGLEILRGNLTDESSGDYHRGGEEPGDSPDHIHQP